MCSPEILAKGQATNIKKLGVPYPLQNQNFFKQKMLEIHGVNHPMQHPEFFKKQQQSAYTRKEFIFPSGRIEYVLGYEHHCINDLLENEKINEDNIIIDPIIIPNFKYIDPVIKDKQHTYFPDILIKSDNLLIEVKSIYTYYQDKLINKTKLLTVQKTHDIQLRIYDYKGTLIKLHLYNKDGTIIKKL